MFKHPDHGLRELVQAASDSWQSLALLPADQALDFRDSLAAMTHRAESRGLTTLEALLSAAEADAGILTSLVGMDAPAAPVHRIRNLLAALCCTVDLRGDACGLQLLAALPRLGRRTRLARGRPLSDDERLVLRLIVTCRLRRGSRNHLAAAKYVLTEIGATPGEATAIYVDNLDDPRHPTCVRMPGNRVREGRTLQLDAWQSEVLGLIATTQAAHGALERPLAFHGGNEPGGSKANMACHRSLDLLLEQAGLWPHGDVTASSITFSAADRIERHEGPEAAIRVLGRTRDPEALRGERAARDLRRLGTEPAPLEPQVRSFLVNPFPPYKPASS